jgi:hypothetical protein
MILQEGTFTEKVPFSLIPFSVYRALFMATVIAGGLNAAIPHQEAIIKFGFPLTLAPTTKAGMGIMRGSGPSLLFSMLFLLLLVLSKNENGDVDSNASIGMGGFPPIAIKVPLK